MLGSMVVVMEEQQPERAVRLYSMVESLQASIGSRLPPKDQEVHDSSLKDLLELLGEDAYSAALEYGKTLNFEESIAFGMESAE